MHTISTIAEYTKSDLIITANGVHVNSFGPIEA